MGRYKKVDLENGMAQLKEFREDLISMRRSIDMLAKSIQEARHSDETVQRQENVICSMRGQLLVYAPIVETLLEGKLDPRIKDIMRNPNEIHEANKFRDTESPRFR